MKAIINANLVMRDHYIPDAVLLMEAGKIVDLSKLPEEGMKRINHTLFTCAVFPLIVINCVTHKCP